MQRALIQYRNPENYELVKEALIKNGRADLIGFDKKCLIPPRKMEKTFNNVKDKNSHNKSQKTGSSSNSSGFKNKSSNRTTHNKSKNNHSNRNNELKNSKQNQIKNGRKERHNGKKAGR